jgi:hypothetical protein
VAARGCPAIETQKKTEMEVTSSDAVEEVICSGIDGGEAHEGVAKVFFLLQIVQLRFSKCTNPTPKSFCSVHLIF